MIMNCEADCSDKKIEIEDWIKLKKEQDEKEELIKDYLPPLRLTEDEAPIFYYKGRHVEIFSDGSYDNTRMLIDGIEQKNVNKLWLEIVNPHYPPVIKIEYLDL